MGKGLSENTNVLLLSCQLVQADIRSWEKFMSGPRVEWKRRSVSRKAGVTWASCRLPGQQGMVWLSVGSPGIRLKFRLAILATTWLFSSSLLLKLAESWLLCGRQVLSRALLRRAEVIVSANMLSVKQRQGQAVLEASWKQWPTLTGCLWFHLFLHHTWASNPILNQFNICFFKKIF